MPKGSPHNGKGLLHQVRAHTLPSYQPTISSLRTELSGCPGYGTETADVYPAVSPMGKGFPW